MILEPRWGAHRHGEALHPDPRAAPRCSTAVIQPDDAANLVRRPGQQSQLVLGGGVVEADWFRRYRGETSIGACRAGTPPTK